MGKLIRVDEDLANLVKKLAEERGLMANGVKLEVLGMNKPNKDRVTKVKKASEEVEYFTDDDNLVLIYMYADAFDLVDQETAEMWIWSALEEINIDNLTDKITIGCKSISVPLGLYHKFKDIAIQKAELESLTIQQIKDKQEEDKAAKKEAAAVARDFKKKIKTKN